MRDRNLRNTAAVSSFTRFASITLAIVLLPSCTYLKYSSVQANYARIQNATPGQVNLKHMLDRESFFVFGKTFDNTGRYTKASMAVAAYSSKYKAHERVDTMFFEGAGTHYGLNLPEGSYTFVAYADLNDDRVFDHTETVAVRDVEIGLDQRKERIAGHIDLQLTAAATVDWAQSLQRPASHIKAQSIFYPAGTIRSLDDPIFDTSMAVLGMYDPASFLEHAPTMFYAEHEDIAHKVPVIFVHGIGGSSRAFRTMVDQLDRDRYKAWYFYYPSGGDLDQFAALFYDIFLSGTVIPMGEMPMVVVAHSMGGLIVREALNKSKGIRRENRVALLATIATPFGGHPSAASGEKHGLIVLPAWRDLNPESEFIRQLYRNPLPASVNHQLLYAYQNTRTLKFGGNSDGVVPLSSQLHLQAQKQSHERLGFNSGHVDVLENQDLIDHLLEKIGAVKSVFPESHIQILLEGGFDLEPGAQYSPLTRHIVRYAGKYLALLVNGRVEPISPAQKRFVQAVSGAIPTSTDVEREFRVFMQQHHELIEAFLAARERAASPARAGIDR